jgi:hypothetical protein
LDRYLKFYRKLWAGDIKLKVTEVQMSFKYLLGKISKSVSIDREAVKNHFVLPNIKGLGRRDRSEQLVR